MIRAFLLANRAGVKAMFLTEYDKEREFELLRREERLNMTRKENLNCCGVKSGEKRKVQFVKKSQRTCLKRIIL